MICEKCRQYEQCFERRGRCSSFETEKQYRKRLRYDIKMLNQKEAPSGAEDSDEDGTRSEDHR